MRDFGLLGFLEDQEDCQENEPSMESQEVAGELIKIMSGKYFLDCTEFKNILIPLKMPEHRRYRHRQEQH